MEVREAGLQTPDVGSGLEVSGSGVAVVFPYNEGKQRLWLVDPTLFFPEVGWLVSGSGVAVPSIMKVSNGCGW